MQKAEEKKQQHFEDDTNIMDMVLSELSFMLASTMNMKYTNRNPQLMWMSYIFVLILKWMTN